MPADPSEQGLCPDCGLPLDQVFDKQCSSHADERFRFKTGLSPMRGLVVGTVVGIVIWIAVITIALIALT